jgi:uncharacterized membrane protein
MKLNILKVIFSGIVFLILDAIYLNLTSSFTQKHIRMIQGSTISMNIYAAILCYVFLIAGLNYFIIEQNKSIMDAFLFGIVIYGVYETTNWAIFKLWPPFLVLIDTLWGGVLFATTTYIVYKVYGL